MRMRCGELRHMDCRVLTRHAPQNFASGGADNSVIIWKSKADGADGVLRYQHNESIQKLAYNPVTQQVVSCTAIDFGLGPCRVVH